MRTTSKARLVFVAVTICATAPPAFAQQSYVEASRNALVRAQPARDAEVRLRLQAGDRLNTVTDQQTNRFYKVFLPNGEVGWVSRYVVRLHRGRGPTLPPPPVVPGVGGGLTTTEREHARFHLLLGKPKGYAEIIREGYVVGYDPRLRIPVWVQYRLTRARSDDNRFPRTDSFEEDGTVPPQARSTLGDYQDSGYARGHMAPAEDMRWSETAEDQSNLITNIAPGCHIFCEII